MIGERERPADEVGVHGRLAAVGVGDRGRGGERQRERGSVARVGWRAEAVRHSVAISVATGGCHGGGAVSVA